MSSSASSLGPTMHHFGGASWSYSTAFPPLQSFPWNIPHTRRSSHQATPSSSLQHSLAPPKYPTYLKQTLYADLAVEQYNYFQSRRSFFPTERQCSNSTNSSLTSSFGRSHTIAPATNSYYAELENLDLRLPTCWNQKDKSRFIEIGRNALDLSYTGPGKSEADAASVRANFPMRPQCGIYYFEMHVLSKGNDGYIGIGFCGADNKLERLPGWDVGSWGYHGDDGNAFAGSGTGRRYGPCFTTGDVIGCGVNFAESSAFYTKNGTLLGDAFNDVPCDAELYPCIGLRTPGERVTVNFGQESFVFDIAQYIKDYKNKVWRDIAENQLPCTNTARATSQTKIKAHHQLNELILSYLVHHGYMSTAKAVVRDSTRLCDKEISLENAELRLYGQNDQDAEKDMLNRQNIRKAIIAGDIDSAINLTNELFPGLLDGPEVGKDALFELKCQKFVEMVRDYGDREQAKRDTEISDEDHCSVNSGRLSIFRDDEHDADEIANYNTDRRRSVGSGCATTPSMHVPGANRQRRLSYAAIAASASPNNNCNGFLAFSASPTAVDNHFDQDDEHGSHSGFGRRHRRASMRRSSTCSSLFSASSNNVPPSHETTVEETLFNEDLEEDSTTGLMKKIMKYGQQLQDEYRNDERPKIRSRLVEIFSLLAYHDVYESPVAHLLDKSCRDDLATTLNTAILAYQKRPQMPPLERMYRQAVLTNKELVLAGHGKAAVINIKEHCCKDVARKDTLSPA